ncbi:hypothetical protein ERJ75_001804000 [Trypanosoma vivax]|uniref:Uncharacterized protein n=1 Tax=Trypanosoma vivax (strain Y486) TaxID=1055687 RepID=F9WVR7_TRYVY|nr:hypothetical protein ERJ75_001804000 [Trypanosoma vivax]CCD21677.1 hypothetical protein, conserved in T. vivax [Trypanosoma vivax Y486]|eukprot:CCD21677.1 hypothetical protein, conserved in T. vivax [Trypanosoma vivax Y486]
MYTGARETVETIQVGRNKCFSKSNVFSTLIDYSEKLNDVKTSLTAWKTEMLEAIKVTCNSTQNNVTTCLAVFTNNQERLEKVMAVAEKLSERLVVLEKKVGAFALVEMRTRADITAADRSMDGTTTSMLSSLNKNGTELCDMLRRQVTVWPKLDEADKSLREVSQDARNASTGPANTKMAATPRSVLMYSALKEIEGLLRSTILSNSAGLPISRNTIVAM